MDALAEPLSPLLGSAFPPNGLAAGHQRLVARLQGALDAEIAPLAADNDTRGRYPTASIAALKRTGFLKAVIPAAYGGLGVPHRVSLEAQVRLGAADSAVAQIYKIHDELIREIFVYAPEELRPRLARAVLRDDRSEERRVGKEC